MARRDCRNRRAKILLDWARHTGFAPAPFIVAKREDLVSRAKTTAHIGPMTAPAHRKDKNADDLAVWEDGPGYAPSVTRLRESGITTGWRSKRWKCYQCLKQFSVKVGTIFEDSPISLTKWLPAMWLLVNCKNGVFV